MAEPETQTLINDPQQTDDADAGNAGGAEVQTDTLIIDIQQSDAAGAEAGDTQQAIQSTMNEDNSDPDETDNESEFNWTEVLKSSAEEESMDIYQMCAFMQKSEDSLPKRYFYYLKAICCLFFQTVGLIIFILNVLRNTEKGWCELTGDWDVRIIATTASLYISLTVGSMITQVNKQGIYRGKSQQFPPFISESWVWIGYLTNNFALISVVYGSFIVIYLSESAVDVVLNAVALFFVLELDDLMIDGSDHCRVIEWIEQEHDAKNDGDEDEDKGCCSIIVECCCGCLEFFTLCCGGLGVGCYIGIGLLGAIVAPFYMAICF